MTDLRCKIKNLVEQVAITCLPWIVEREGDFQFVDPLDDMEISAHYGATHCAVALIIYGEEHNQEYAKFGKSLLESLLSRWETCRRLKGFHHDFNNFALCVLDGYTDMYHEEIVDIVLTTSDSNHDTVNWLPMRWYVNRCRYAWTGEEKYKKRCDQCFLKIREATYNDGFIDDRLPKGISFNLQYDVATVAGMQFLRVAGEEIDITKELGALLNAVCPDGDINYLGRGTNQIFAWGLWIYLLASSGCDELNRALGYIEERLPIMLKNHNLMLNDYPGEEKYLWWDYHYCSVYTAHFFLWLVLALKDMGRNNVVPYLESDGSSGVHIWKNENEFIAAFDGRTEYLAERGPVIAAIWSRKYGVICKGTFGPWQGAFGNKYMQPGVTLRNFVGLIAVKIKRDWTKNCIIRKLLSKVPFNAKEEIHPVFSMVDVEQKEEFALMLDVEQNNVLFSAALLCPHIESVQLCKDEQIVMAWPLISIRNQYGKVNIIQAPLSGKGKWRIRFI